MRPDLHQGREATVLLRGLMDQQERKSMAKERADLASLDRRGGSLIALALWGLPGVVAAVSLVFAGRSPWLFLLAGAAFTVMGSACVVNAARCGRLHCFITGPYFLLLALGAMWAFVGDMEPFPSMRIWLLAGFSLSPLLVWLPEHLAGRKYRNAAVCDPESTCDR